MNKGIYCVMVILALATGACKQTEKTEAVTADIEAAQMAGRNAAKEYLLEAPKDTMEMQRSLLRARSKGARFEDPKARAAFDSAFVSTVRTVRGKEL